MSRIIAGRFDRTLDADAALEALRREGFTSDEIDTFYVSPPGQHAMTPVGGEAPFASAGSRFAASGAIAGAALGALLGFAVAWLVADEYRVAALVFGAALGAYVGSFLGTASKLRGGRREEATREHPVEPRGGRMIAVCVDRSGMQPRALKVLREYGARDLGRAEGTWRNGWKDFDPRAPLMTP
ncbi:MAG: hypothetical protein A3G81_30055 [Betaproteobacteria bacterium RIFCSPLOWO2_12_FULL_65_14]|nr:MAG: hypothetical protein A3G81_30055 [Betaproteobacteria bacterium RIFCSPLOWO2_12_FULL_65_14]